MPESTCLHIQGRESGPIRVVELPWISVRIGRAAYCEVQLPEYDAADEACRLQRRGRSWHLMPVAVRSLVLLEGRPVDGPCQLPFDVPFTIGTYCLTLRRDRAAEPDWEMYQGPAPRQLNHSAPALDSSFSANASSDRSRLGPVDRPTTEREEPPAAAVGRAEPRKERSRGTGVNDRWEARWRAAGAELKSRAERTQTAAGAKRPDYGTRYDSVPLKEPRVARTQPVAPPKVDPAIRPIPTPPVARIEATRVGAHLETDEPASLPEDSTIVATVREALADSPPPHPFEESDFENRLELAISDAIENEPDHSLVREPVVDTSIGTPRRSGEAHQILGGGKLWGTRVGDRQTEPPAAEPQLADPFPEILGTPEVIESRQEISPVIDPIDAQEDKPATNSEHSSAAIEDEPPRYRPDSKKRKGAASGAELIGTPPSYDEARPIRRERGGHRLNEANRAAASPGGRMGAERHRLDGGSLGAEASDDHMAWPSVQDILTVRRARPNPAAPPRTPVKPKRRTETQTSPTLAREPNQWTLPLWLAWPPLAAFVLCTGMVGCVLSWSWGNDSYSAAIMTNRLILADATGRRTPLPDSVAPPRGTWMETSAQHLAHWAIYLNRFEPRKDDSQRVVRELLDRAIQVSPINPTARLAMAQLEVPASEPTSSIRSLGLSRDPLSLAWSGRRLLEAGKKDAALTLYRQALEVASRGDLSQVTAPRFNDDQGTPRYLLPGEERIREIVREMAARNEWTANEWLEILPQQTLATLATARVLREQARNEIADALLDTRLNQTNAPASGGPIDALAMAARAEAFALRSRWQEADLAYREAIELLDDETLKRSWWFNLADIAFRLPDDAKRQAALRATLTVAASDDISRRATEILRATHSRPRLRSTGAKAN